MARKEEKEKEVVSSTQLGVGQMKTYARKTRGPERCGLAAGKHIYNHFARNVLCTKWGEGWLEIPDRK